MTITSAPTVAVEVVYLKQPLNMVVIGAAAGGGAVAVLLLFAVWFMFCKKSPNKPAPSTTTNVPQGTVTGAVAPGQPSAAAQGWTPMPMAQPVGAATAMPVAVPVGPQTWQKGNDVSCA